MKAGYIPFSLSPYFITVLALFVNYLIIKSFQNQILYMAK